MTEILTREVTIDEGGGAPATPAYAAFPAGEHARNPRYGVVVIHEVFGRRPDIDRACDRIAREGVAVIAPDLMAGRRVQCLVEMMRTSATGGSTVAALQTKNAQAWLTRETGLPATRMAILGFCIGGGFVLALGHGYGAVSTNYGGVPKTEVMRGLGPVIGCYGGRDRVFSPSAKSLQKRLTELGVRHEVHVFPEAGHSFLTDADHGLMRYVALPMTLVDTPEAREAGWKKIFAFFDQTFEGIA